MQYQEPGLYPYPEEDIEWDERAPASGCVTCLVLATLASIALWLIAMGLLIALVSLIDGHTK